MIADNIKEILSEIPKDVHLIAASKTRKSAEILEAINAGIEMIGENYVQEAANKIPEIGNKAKWHLIGHLQKNKVKKAVEIFNMIQTVDSIGIAAEIAKRSAENGRIMEVLIEINSGREEQKFGVFPENAEDLIQAVSKMNNIKVMGLMTMGPLMGNHYDFIPYFRTTKELFDKFKKLDIINVEMKYLSMGMTNSYKTAVKEGANMIRVGTKIFGNRE